MKTNPEKIEMISEVKAGLKRKSKKFKKINELMEVVMKEDSDEFITL